MSVMANADNPSARFPAATLAAASPNKSLQTQPLLDEMVSTAKAARLLGISTATLRNKRSRGDGPKGYVRTSRCSGAYPLSSVLEYREQRKKGGAKHASPFRPRS